MSGEAWATVGVVLLVFALLVFTRMGPDMVMVAGLVVLLTIGVLEPSEALIGFSNEGMMTVAVLFVVAAGLRETGGVAFIAQRWLRRPKSVTSAQAQLMAPVALSSAFLNNTPIVAMMLPLVSEWAKRNRLSVSRLMMPLSYAAVLGGLCTLIGTSTNLVVNGLLINDPSQKPLGMFDVTWVGLPCAAVGIAYILIVQRWLLADRRPAINRLDDPREYTAEMLVEPGSALVGQTIEQAGLRHLPGMYLMEIERQGQVMPAVAPQERLQADDRLVFVGIVESVVDLQRFRGLKPATDQVFKLDAPRSQRTLVEAVVSNTCRLLGMTIRGGKFRTVYNAAVIAVARNGQRIRKKVGDIVLQAGDTLLLEAPPAFVDQQRNSRDFFLVSRVDDSSPIRHERAWLSLAILLAMVLAVTIGWLTMLNGAMLAAGALIATRCISGSAARRCIDWQVLVAIAAAFGIGQAMQVTGAAEAISNTFIGWAGRDPWVALAAVYFITMIFTEMLTNNAAAVLVYPIAKATAVTLGVSLMPFVMAVMVAASCGFATPIGYQTHLMVYGPGGYRFSDFLRMGIPLDLLIGLVTVLIAPVVYPF